MNLFVVFTSFLVLAGVVFESAQAEVTFYHSRTAFLEALAGATIVENIAKRGIANPTGWNQRAEHRNLPFSQCDLTFLPPNSAGSAPMTIWNYQLPEIQAFNGSDAYSFRVGGDYASPRAVETSQPFFAVGFDHVSKGQGNRFSIKVFDEETREYSSHLANRGHKAKFYGWIADNPEEATSLFEIGPVNNNVVHFMFTNIVYATYDASALTQIGCYVTNAALRSCSATAWGDPHIVTFDGLKFEAHPKGEAIFLKAKNSTLQIQGRFDKIRTGQNSGPAITTGIAVRGDDPSQQADIQVTMASSDNTTGTVLDERTQTHLCPVELYVDGLKSESLIYNVDVNGPQVKVIGSRIRVEYRSLQLVIEMRVQYWRDRCYFSTDFHLFDCESLEADVIGLLGSPNVNYTDDWMTRNGDVLALPEDPDGLHFQPAFDYVKENWIITNDTDSLFYYETGSSFEDFANPDEVYDNELEALAADVPPDVAMLCDGDVACLIDGGELGEEAALEYLENPASERTVAPTDVPTFSPTEVDSGECEQRERRRLETLEERWKIHRPALEFSDLDVTLDFGISSTIVDQQQVVAELYERDCSVPYSNGLNKANQINLGGFFDVGVQYAPVVVSIDSDAISQDAQVYKDNDLVNGTPVTAEVDFCMRFSVYTPQEVGVVAEVNFLEVVVKLDFNLTDGFQLGNFNVAPYNRCEVEADEAFEVEGYFCEDGAENIPSVPPVINQGDFVKVCVRPVQRARDLFVRMRDIREFTFYNDQGVSQVVINNYEVENEGLSEMWCERGYGVCHFETLLFASFFARPGTIIGSGYADMQFGGLGDDSVTPKQQRRGRNLRFNDPSIEESINADTRELQQTAVVGEGATVDVAGSSFEMEFTVQQARFNQYKDNSSAYSLLSSTGKDLNFWLQSVGFSCTLMSLTTFVSW